MSTKKRSPDTKYLYKLMIILVLAAFISSTLTVISYNMHKNGEVYDIKVLNATFSVGKFVGMAVDTDRLNFGVVFPGGSSTKTIQLYHNYTKPLLIRIDYTGSISQILLPVKPFILKPKTSMNVTFDAYAGYHYANYSGKVIITYIKT